MADSMATRIGKPEPLIYGGLEGSLKKIDADY